MAPAGQEESGVADRGHVVVVNDWWYPDTVGGAEKAAADSAAHLDAHGFAVRVLVPAHQDFETIDSHGLRVHRVARPLARREPQGSGTRHLLETAASLADPRSALRMADRVASFGPDLVVIHNQQRIHPAFVPSLRRRLPDVPVVRVVHDLSDLCWTRTRYRGGSPCTATCQRCRTRAALASSTQSGRLSWVLANSCFVAGELQAAGVFSDVPLTVGYPGLRAARELRDRVGPRPTRRAGHTRFGFIGRPTPEKGVLVAIEAVATFREQQQDVELLIAGHAPGAAVQHLLEEGRRLDVPITTLGHVPVSEFADLVDVALVPSLWPEPFGMTALELAALRVPTVVSARGGLPEAVELFPDAPVAVVPDPTALSIANAAMGLLDAPTATTGTHDDDAGPRPSAEDALLEVVEFLLGGSTLLNIREHEQYPIIALTPVQPEWFRSPGLAPLRAANEAAKAAQIVEAACWSRATATVTRNRPSIRSIAGLRHWLPVQSMRIRKIRPRARFTGSVRPDPTPLRSRR